MIPEEAHDVGVSGHRKQSFSDHHAAWTQSALFTVLGKLQSEHNAGFLNSGMALGTDIWAVQAALALEVPLATRAFIPFAGQEDRWSQPQQQLYRTLLAKCTTVNCTDMGDQEGRPLPMGIMKAAFNDRNEALVESSDVLVAVSTRRSNGGTADAICRALMHDVQVILLDPRRETITVPSTTQLEIWFELEKSVAWNMAAAV